MIIEKRYIVLFLIAFHVIGLIGILINPAFINLTPINILLVYLLLLASEKFNLRLLVISLVVITSGIIVEAIGVNTGVIFGNYTYHGTLGPKVFNTPLIIGVNWFLITYCAYQFIGKFIDNLFVKIVVSSAICTLFDFVLEPVAIKYNFWSWADLEIPLYNYFCWFLFSALFTLMYSRLPIKKKVPTSILLIWFIFFISLMMFL